MQRCYSGRSLATLLARCLHGRRGDESPAVAARRRPTSHRTTCTASALVGRCPRLARSCHACARPHHGVDPSGVISSRWWAAARVQSSRPIKVRGVPDPMWRWEGAGGRDRERASVKMMCPAGICTEARGVSHVARARRRCACKSLAVFRKRICSLVSRILATLITMRVPAFAVCSDHMGRPQEEECHHIAVQERG